ncbi:Ldh family oxidoreductase [Paralimibaculum aggregatum]|uniref:Ldh family oxidoreductase n=1 Tax=Paralimibaculum aggregatum TaxID=3036245 RepID=A0ABQ6LSP3_9RHOB|nr:Ldh family oxidoreductase [Limibaculum sp. NKW23]GMG85092.1 Ldh family oxidoreductase [Limibaculum sp. NKW23]
MTGTRSKLELRGPRVTIMATEAAARVEAIFRALGASADVARQVGEHLADTSLCGMESHGVMRVLQYAAQIREGDLTAGVAPVCRETELGAHEVDGGGGIGIPAMRLAFDEGCRLAQERGIAAIAIRNCGHTGRHGAFADDAAQSGFLTFLMGGGNRQKWRQVAPHGGARAMLPTNPWCIGAPGGAHGPVVLDFATSKIAGGWIYAARSAGALLPEGCLIDREGRPTRDPEDYFDGGAILPSGGHKGFALALMGELIGEALLGPVSVECNWLLIAIDPARYRSASRLTVVAEEILEELRTCPPAPGFDRVEIPGEREREHRAAAKGAIAIPEATWAQITELARSLGVA